MALLKKVYQFFIFTNLLIAVAAIAQCSLTYLVLHLEYSVYVLLIEGTSTLLLYNLSLYLSKPKNPETSPYLRTRWIFGHQGLFWSNNILAAIGLCYALMHVHLYTWGYLGFIGLLSVLYAFPVFRVHGVRGGARQLPYVKLFYIAIIWSLSTVGLPVVEAYTSGMHINWYLANHLGVVKVIFLLLLTLPFDIRDMRQDALYRLKTIPNLLGKNKAIRFCYGLLAIHTLLIIFSPHGLLLKLGLLLTNLFVAYVYRFVVFSKDNYHGVYMLDIGLIVQFLFVSALILAF